MSRHSKPKARRKGKKIHQGQGIGLDHFSASAASPEHNSAVLLVVFDVTEARPINLPFESFKGGTIKMRHSQIVDLGREQYGPRVFVTTETGEEMCYFPVSAITGNQTMGRKLIASIRPEQEFVLCGVLPDGKSYDREAGGFFGLLKVVPKGFPGYDREYELMPAMPNLNTGEKST